MGIFGRPVKDSIRIADVVGGYIACEQVGQHTDTSDYARPIRVALVLYRDDLHIGGSLRVVESLANSFDARLVEAHLVFTYGGPGPVSERATVPCHFLASSGPRDLRGWMRARRIIGNIEPDILHFHNPVYWLHAALATRRYKKLFHLHGPYFPSSMGRLERFLAMQMPKLVDAEICITKGMRDLVLKWGWGRPERTWVVYNAIDCSFFENLPPKVESRAMLELPQNALILAVVCRLAWYKGCQDAIRILSRLDPCWHLVFCGDGPIRGELIRLAEQHSVLTRVHFTGMLADVRPAYAAMDAFLFLSRLEPFGLVIAEAMAARVPVFGLTGEGEYRDPDYPLVTADNSVFLERAQPDSYRLPEDPQVLDRLAALIGHLRERPESYKAMIDRAHKFVSDRFDGHIQAKSMTEIYARVLSRSRTAVVGPNGETLDECT